MPEPVNGSGGAEQEQKAPTEDVFGEPVGAPKEEGGEEAPEVKDAASKATPTQQIADLSKKLGEYEATMRARDDKDKEKDENIRAMRETIKRLEKQVGTGKKQDEGAGEDEVLFKEIRTSKDLKAEEKEDMTETELKQLDEIAALKSGMNQLFKAVKEGKPAAKDDEGAKGGDDTTKLARDYALEIAGKDTAIANEIIEQYNEFNNEGLTAEQVKARIEKAAKLTPNYKPPKEQEKKHGGAAKGGGEGADPFGVDGIISEVEESRKGGTYKL